MKHPAPDNEIAPLETALRAALDPAAAPPLSPGFAARVAARATAPDGSAALAGSTAPAREKKAPGRWTAFPAMRWAWAGAAAAVILAVLWGGGVLRPAPAALPAPPPVRQATASRADRATQIRQLRYAIAFTRAEIASITGEAVRPSLRNLSAQVSRNQP